MVEWDGKSRGNGEAGEGVSQSSPLSPMLFLILLVPTIYKMEEALRRTIPVLQNKVNCYVYDLPLSITDTDGTSNMERMVKKGSEILCRIGEADGIPLEKAKEEMIIFGKKGSKGETVKWLGIILYRKLKFQEHLNTRVKRATQMLGNLRRL